MPLIFAGAGMLLTFWRPLVSGFSYLPRDNSDTRLLHYFLEHSYLWLTRSPPHQAFWNAPFFFPVPNVMAYSDLLVGGAFPYWLFRIVVDPHSAFGLWMLASSALNFLAFFLLLRGPLKLGSLASCVGAYLFSFAHLRLTQFGHFQLLPQYYVVIAVYALIRLGQGEVREDLVRFRRWLAVFLAAFVLQLYTGFYFAWYLAFTISGAILYGICRSSSRAFLFCLAKKHRRSLVGLGFIASLCVAPLAWHYLQHARVAGYRGFGNMRESLVPLRAWFYFGSENWFYGRLGEFPFFASVTGNIEKRLGLGFFTLALAGAALWRSRRTRGVKEAMVFSIVVIVAVSRLPGGIELWRIPYYFFPGAKAVSAVPRYSFFVLMVLAWGLALAVEWAREKRGLRKILLAGLIFLSLAEQGATVAVYNAKKVNGQVGEIAEKIPPGCSSFLLVPTADAPAFPDSQLYHLDAMWAGLQRGVPTLNGYSGSSPVEYPFLFLFEKSRRRDDLEARLGQWASRTGLTTAPCRVEFRGRLDYQGQ